MPTFETTSNAAVAEKTARFNGRASHEELYGLLRHVLRSSRRGDATWTACFLMIHADLRNYRGRITFGVTLDYVADRPEGTLKWTDGKTSAAIGVLSDLLQEQEEEAGWAVTATLDAETAFEEIVRLVPALPCNQDVGSEIA